MLGTPGNSYPTPAVLPSNLCPILSLPSSFNSFQPPSSSSAHFSFSISYRILRAYSLFVRRIFSLALPFQYNRTNVARESLSSTLARTVRGGSRFYFVYCPFHLFSLPLSGLPPLLTSIFIVALFVDLNRARIYRTFSSLIFSKFLPFYFQVREQHTSMRLYKFSYGISLIWYLVRWIKMFLIQMKPGTI